MFLSFFFERCLFGESCKSFAPLYGKYIDRPLCLQFQSACVHDNRSGRALTIGDLIFYCFKYDILCYTYLPIYTNYRSYIRRSTAQHKGAAMFLTNEYKCDCSHFI